MKSICLSIVFLFSNILLANADWQKLQDLYKQREDLKQVQVGIDLGEDLRASLADEAVDFALLYDVSILTSRLYYAKGRLVKKRKEVQKAYEAAMEVAMAAQEVAELDIGEEYAEAYYYFGIALGRWAKSKGIIKSVKRRHELFNAMKTAKKLKQRNGGAGEATDGFGPDRTLGKMYHALPKMFDGDHGLAVVHLRKAVQKAPEFLLNKVYLAEALRSGNKKERAEACVVLADVMAVNIDSLDPNRMPEHREDINEATRLYKQFKCK